MAKGIWMEEWTWTGNVAIGMEYHSPSSLSSHSLALKRVRYPFAFEERQGYVPICHGEHLISAVYSKVRRLDYPIATDHSRFYCYMKEYYGIITWPFITLGFTTVLKSMEVWLPDSRSEVLISGGTSCSQLTANHSLNQHHMVIWK